MKPIIIILLLIPILSFSNEKEAQCAAAVNIKLMPTFSNFFFEKAKSIMDDDQQFIKHFHPKVFSEYKLCRKRKNLDQCDKYDDIFQKLKEKHYPKISNRDIDPRFCDFEDMTDDLKDIIETDQQKPYKKCIKSKNQLKFIADFFNLPSKYIKNNKELNIEINEIYGIDVNKNKYCNSIPLLNHVDTDKNIIKRCKNLIKKVNLFVKLRNKCLKE